MNNLYDILEICLSEVENGMDLEMVLARYPEQADELRPILQAAIHAKSLAVPAPSADVVRRSRAKFLQHAAQMRETQPAVPHSWFPSFQRLAVAVVLLLLFFVSSTGMVRASSISLPGDGLYSVKRAWENTVLFFTFDAEAYQALELEYETERLDEISELFASGRPAKVDFAGIVTRQNGAGWRVANILVIVSEQTTLPDQPVAMGAAVRVTGITNGDGIVLAEQIELLPVDAIVPEVEDDESEIEVEQPSVTPQPGNQNSTPASSAEAPDVEITTTPSPVATPRMESFEGILNSINRDVWTVNDIAVLVATAEIKGVPVIGARAKVEGYYRPDGDFVAIKIEVINIGSSSSNSNSNNNDSSGTNTNSNSNDNGGSNSNDNDDDNDNSGKDDNSNDDNSNDDNSNDDNNNNGG